jgi:site-specific recombinase XerD
MGQIEQSELSPETKRDFKIFLRKFYQFLRGCGPDDEMPPEVKWLKLKIQKSKKKQPEELIREVETKGMIMSGISTRDRAFVCLLSETGARISEIGTIKLKNISFEKYGVRIRVIGKTGPRSILVVFSTPYLKHWINKHPDNNNPEAYLWPNPKGELLSYAALTKILKKAAEKAGISKRIHPHLMRNPNLSEIQTFFNKAPQICAFH